jgi:hypothetical protein
MSTFQIIQNASAFVSGIAILTLILVSAIRQLNKDRSCKR